MAAAEVAVLAFADVLGLLEELAAADELVPADELVAAAAGALDELELLHPAASRIDPTAAVAATIAFDARKVTLPCPPGG
jgi:hypothetical protein